MVKNSTQPVLLRKLFERLERHRRAFGQERVYWRAVGMVMGAVFNFGRHTVTQDLMALGVTDGDWSGWYRRFRRKPSSSDSPIPLPLPLGFNAQEGRFPTLLASASSTQKAKVEERKKRK